MWAWGNNQYGQLGNGDISNYNTEEPQRVVALAYDAENPKYLENVKQITAGTYFAAALMEDGRVVTWGQNSVGQLGQNYTSTGALPSYVLDGEGRDITGIKEIAAGKDHMLALAEDGTVWAWGLNNYGELGIGVGHTTNTNVNGKRIYAVKVITEIDTGEADENGDTIYDYPALSGIKQVSCRK